MCWNMMEYLPEDAGCQAQFNVLVASYISKVYQHLQANSAIGATPRRRRNPSQALVSQQLGVGAHETSVEFVKEFINAELAQKMFRVAEKIHKKVPSMRVESRDAMLSRTQGKGDLLKPALELVKSVCKVLELDTSITDEVTRLKRNLLRLIGVGEFSSEAQWTDPCLSYVLSEVICESCNHCRDIDLCKDPHRVLDEDGTTLHWQCPVCEHFYSNQTIEYLLIDALNRKTMAYTLQDLQCCRCYQIKMDNMSPQCVCAGQYQTLISGKDLPAALATFGNIARIFQMPLLEEVVEWVQDRQEGGVR
uniref:DNA polymerase epsilon catalytic subunit n=2 Tax=Cacopsylla melanoneura TaxID=428564 RepID=A0A8D9ASY8_9HEMI